MGRSAGAEGCRLADEPPKEPDSRMLADDDVFSRILHVAITQRVELTTFLRGGCSSTAEKGPFKGPSSKLQTSLESEATATEDSHTVLLPFLTHSQPSSTCMPSSPVVSACSRESRHGKVAILMQSSGDKLLAGPRLTGHQHGEAGVRQSADGRKTSCMAGACPINDGNSDKLKHLGQGRRSREGQDRCMVQDLTHTTADEASSPAADGACSLPSFSSLVRLLPYSLYWLVLRPKLCCRMALSAIRMFSHSVKRCQHHAWEHDQQIAHQRAQGKIGSQRVCFMRT